MKKFSISDRLKSFVCAFKGIKLMLKFEHNAWIHVLATIVVVLAGIYFKISKTEWLMVIFSIGSVFTCEAINTATEKLADAISLEKNEHIKKAKDIGAGAVLIAAITAVTIGLIVFVPYLIGLF